MSYQSTFTGVQIDAAVTAVTDRRFGGATDYTSFDADGTIQYNGAATVFDDCAVDLGAIKPPASGPPTYTAYKGSEVATFSASATNTLNFRIQVPHSYKEGSDIFCHFHAAYPNGNSGNSRWQLSYSWANVDTAFPTATTILATFAAPAVTDKSVIHNFGTISGAGKTISSVLLMSLARLGADGADTYASVIYGTSADIHFEKNTEGSRTEYTK